jgi:hypothetical protein
LRGVQGCVIQHAIYTPLHPSQEGNRTIPALFISNILSAYTN